MKYAVEVRLVDKPDWQRMRHIFENERGAENICAAALGARDVVEARVVEIGSENPDSAKEGE